VVFYIGLWIFFGFPKRDSQPQCADEGNNVTSTIPVWKEVETTTSIPNSPPNLELDEGKKEVEELRQLLSLPPIFFNIPYYPLFLLFFLTSFTF